LCRRDPSSRITCNRGNGKRAKEIVDQLKSEVEKEGIDCEVIPELADEVADCIIEEAKKRNVDLIIVGKKKKRPILTSVAIPVTAHCPLDVLVVPEGIKPDFSKILIAVDGTVYSELAAKKGFEMVKKLGSEVLVISVAENDEDVSYVEEAVNLTQYVAEKEGVSIRQLSRGLSIHLCKFYYSLSSNKITIWL